MNYNEQLDALFSRWIASYPADEQGRFCKDGLMLKPYGDVDELWEKAERKVMFVVKDNPHGGHDTRTWLKDPKNKHLKGQFLSRIAETFYALWNLTAEEKSREVYKFANVKGELHGKVEETFFSKPFAFVEAKKLAGSRDVLSKVVYDAMTKDEAFFKEELAILHPNVIVCCDAGNSQFNFITSKCFCGKNVNKIEYEYPASPDIKCGLWYYPFENVAVIKSFHPSYVTEEWKFFEKVLSPFSALLKQLW